LLRGSTDETKAVKGCGATVPAWLAAARMPEILRLSAPEGGAVKEKPLKAMLPLDTSPDTVEATKPLP